MDTESGSQTAIRPTKPWQRAALCLVPIVDLTKDLLVFILGLHYIMTAESTEDAIMNALAVAFVSEVDELMYSTYINKV